jgi:OFA family oxalate/formate antiporter-like MFS transporter
MSRKHLVLICGMVIQICLGGIYAWGIFVPSLRQEHGLSTAQTQMIFGTAIAAWTLAMIPAGWVLPRFGPKKVAGMGGLLFLAGSGVAAFSAGSFWLLWLGVGCLIGASIGCGYVCAISLFAQWFPARRGLATGLAVGSFAAGAILEAALAEYMLEAGQSALQTLGWIGLGYGLLIGLAALGLSAPAGTTCRRAELVVPLRQLLADRRFRLAVLGISSGTFAGLLVIGNLKSIGLAGGLSPAVCTIGVSLFAVGSASGRITWGWISDWAGPRTMPLSLLVLAGAVLLIYPASFAAVLFVPACVLVGFGYGACFVLYAAHIAGQYGVERVGAIYPLAFLAFGLSGVAGPVVGGWLFDVSSSYLAAILVATFVTLIGAAGVHNLLNLRRRVWVQQTSREPAA